METEERRPWGCQTGLPGGLLRCGDVVTDEGVNLFSSTWSWRRGLGLEQTVRKGMEVSDLDQVSFSLFQFVGE